MADSEASPQVSAEAPSLVLPRTSKRKRNQVSYLDDDYFDGLDIQQPAHDCESEANEDEDDSGVFGRKVSIDHDSTNFVH